MQLDIFLLVIISGVNLVSMGQVLDNVLTRTAYNTQLANFRGKGYRNADSRSLHLRHKFRVKSPLLTFN